MWNLIVRVSSGLGALLLVISAGLVIAAELGFTDNVTAGTVTLFFAVCLVVFSLAALNLSDIHARREIKLAASTAGLLANGEPPAEFGDGELSDALRNVSEYISEKSAVARRIAAGDLTGDIRLRGDADVIGQSFHDMIEALRRTARSQTERDRIQNTLARILSDSSFDPAAGAENRNGFGRRADDFDSFQRHLRALVERINDISAQVETAATGISDTTEQLIRGTEAETAQRMRTTSAVSGMSRQLKEISDKATQSAKFAAETFGNAQGGVKAARDNLNAMTAIRKQVQETAKRIKKLGERSQEISQIVKLIDDLSDRTSLLALNASLRASSSTTADSGFAVLTEEVERLAERSSRLTQQISGLSQTLLTETKELVAAMEETIHQVVVGSALANKTGQSLTEVEGLSKQLAGLLQNISRTTTEQAKHSIEIYNSMSAISNVTEVIQLGSSRASESVKKLVSLTDDLRRTVSPLKITAASGGSNAAEPNSFVN